MYLLPVFFALGKTLRVWKGSECEYDDMLYEDVAGAVLDSYRNASENAKAKNFKSSFIVIRSAVLKITRKCVTK
jgi:hypothetical protein